MIGLDCHFWSTVPILSPQPMALNGTQSPTAENISITCAEQKRNDNKAGANGFVRWDASLKSTKLF